MANYINFHTNEIKDETIYRQCLALQGMARVICQEIEEKFRTILEECGGEYGLDCSDKVVTAPTQWSPENNALEYFTEICLDSASCLCAVTNEEVVYPLAELDVTSHIALWAQYEYTQKTLE